MSRKDDSQDDTRTGHGRAPAPGLDKAGSNSGSEPRRIDIRLHLLDRQVVDIDERMVCKVDDLELEIGQDGHPYVTAILCGPIALGNRFRGRLGRWMVAIARRLRTSGQDQPNRISFSLVTDIGSSVSVGVRHSDLNVEALEDWMNEHVIERLPGSRDAG